jgi:hypothetical protein
MSDKYSLNVDDMKKLGKNALFVGVAAALAYLGQNAANLDLGSATVVLVPVITTVINAVMTWAKDNTK